MHDDLRWNKLFGAILATGLLILVLRQGTEMLFAPPPFPAHPGDKVTIQEAASTDEGAVADTPPDWGTVLPKADVAAGQLVSTKCQSCHNFANGGPNQTGPNLWGVIGRQPGTHPGFAYSAAMQAFGQKLPKWDYDHVYMFLAGPQAYISGTKMSFVGLKKPEDRINVIAWLRQQNSDPPAIPAPNPKAAAAAAGAAAAAPGAAPAPNAGTTVPAAAGNTTAPATTNTTAPTDSAAASPGGAAPTTGAAAAPSATVSNPGSGGVGGAVGVKRKP